MTEQILPPEIETTQNPPGKASFSDLMKRIFSDSTPLRYGAPTDEQQQALEKWEAEKPLEVGTELTQGFDQLKAIQWERQNDYVKRAEAGSIPFAAIVDSRLIVHQPSDPTSETPLTEEELAALYPYERGVNDFAYQLYKGGSYCLQSDLGKGFHGKNRVESTYGIQRDGFLVSVGKAPNYGFGGLTKAYELAIRQKRNTVDGVTSVTTTLSFTTRDLELVASESVSTPFDRSIQALLLSLLPKLDLKKSDRATLEVAVKDGKATATLNVVGYPKKYRSKDIAIPSGNKALEQFVHDAMSQMQAAQKNSDRLNPPEGIVDLTRRINPIQEAYTNLKYPIGKGNRLYKDLLVILDQGSELPPEFVEAARQLILAHESALLAEEEQFKRDEELVGDDGEFNETARVAMEELSKQIAALEQERKRLIANHNYLYGRKHGDANSGIPKRNEQVEAVGQILKDMERYDAILEKAGVSLGENEPEELAEEEPSGPVVWT